MNLNLKTFKEIAEESNQFANIEGVIKKILTLGLNTDA